MRGVLLAALGLSLLTVMIPAEDLIDPTGAHVAIPDGAVELAGAPAPEGATQLPASHGFFVPYMDTAAINIQQGIGPGAWIRLGDAYCTGAFVVEDQVGDLYLTTAAHCTGFEGQRVEVKQATPVAAVADWEAFGTVVEAWPGWALDAALIKIDPDKLDDVDPTMPGWGGPVGMVTDGAGGQAEVRHYGWGWVTWYEHETRCREGPLASLGSTTWWSETTGGGGDSGSGAMLADGRALGIVDWGREVTYVYGGAFVAEQMGGVRLDVALSALGSETGLTLTLVEGGPVNDLCMPEAWVLG